MKKYILILLLVFYSSILFSKTCYKYTIHPVEITLKKGKTLIGFVQHSDDFPDSPYDFEDTEVLVHKSIFKIIPPFCLGNSNCPSNLRHIISNNKMTKRIWIDNIKDIKPHKNKTKMSAYSRINELPDKTIKLLLKGITPLKTIYFESVSTDKFLIISYNPAYSDVMLEKIKNKVMKEVFLPNKYGEATVQRRGSFYQYNEKYKNEGIVFYNNVTDCTLKTLTRKLSHSFHSLGRAKSSAPLI